MSTKREYNLKSIRRQSSQFPCNFHVVGIIPSKKEIKLNHSIAPVHNSKQFNNEASYDSTHHSKNTSCIDVESSKSSFACNGSRNSTDRLEFRQSHMEIFRMFKGFMKRKHFYNILLFTLVLSIVIGIITYGVWLHNLRGIRQSKIYEKMKANFAHVTEIVKSNYELNDTVILATKDLGRSERLKTINTSISVNSSVEPSETQDPSFTEAMSKSKAHTTYSTFEGFFKVSPTLPIIDHNVEFNGSSVNRIRTQEDNNCSSTSLDICRGVLNYDLTYTKAVKQLDAVALKDLDILIKSKCSARAIEFICTLLEPECRPRHIGILQPCRRLCKAISEACSLIISNVDTLMSLFDCNRYPDSNDWNECDEPTIRRRCYETEFACSDRSCIPLQWQCDKIKDCAGGEDENGCRVCTNPDDFRCHSNEKCIPEFQRCNLFNDCFDNSDEQNCNEYSDTNIEYMDINETHYDMNPRIYPYISYLLPPNQTNQGVLDIIAPFGEYTTDTKPIADDSAFNITDILSKSQTKTIITEYNSSSLVSFRDSKEIMVTSGSENKLKYTKINFTRSPRTYTRPPLSWIKQDSNSTAQDSDKSIQNTCGLHQLRCVSGKCINVDQLCDKIIDCSDGFDELMCVYKEQKDTTQTP